MTVSEAFHRAMAGFGLTDSAPRLAVAVSGGGDSMALALLAADWLRDRGGRLTVLTVNHGLRPAAADEARQVAGWMADRGIAHKTLTWRPQGAVTQAQAREARYRLLDGACRARGIRHLLVGHTVDDQAETVAMRRERGDGPGLAGMSAKHHLRHCTVLRPLLQVDRAALRRFLTERSAGWIDDPSNENTAFERIRWRRRLASDPALRQQLLSQATVAARQRVAEEAAAERLVGEAVTLTSAGEALLARGFLAEPQAPVALGAVIAAVRGACRHVPVRRRLERAVADLRGGAGGVSLGGCVVHLAGEGWRVCREAGRIDAPLALRPGVPARWDGRFTVSAPLAGEVRPLGGSQALLQRPGVSARGAAALPGLWREDRLIGLPDVGGLDLSTNSGDASACEMVLKASFDPSQPLAPAVFHIV